MYYVWILWASYPSSCTAFDYRFKRLCLIGKLDNSLLELSKIAGNDGNGMVGASHLQVHRAAATLRKKGFFPAASDAQEAG